MKKLIYSLMLLGLLVAVYSCSGSEKKPQENPKPDSIKVTYPLPPVGVVIPHQTFGGDSSNNYALFIPSSFEKTKEYPVILLFDPHADGALPLEMYKDLANEFGFVLACSNSSKNLAPLEGAESDFKKIFDDIGKRLTIAHNGIIVGGFSGGGKTAIFLANKYHKVNGLINCSGPESLTPMRPDSNFSIYGLAGKLDFNYLFMKGVEYQTRLLKFDQYFIYPKMTHEWPTKEIMADAFLWMKFKCMLSGAMPKNQTWLDSVWTSWEDKYKSSTKYSERHFLAKRMVKFFAGLKDPGIYKTALDSLEKDPVIANAETAEIQSIVEEKQMYENFTDGFSNWTTAEWTREINRMKGIAKKDQGLEGERYSRVLGMLGMDCYRLGMQGVNESAYEETEKLLTIYQILEPKNTEPPYLQARLAARQHHDDRVGEELRKALAIGFNDLNRISSEEDFFQYKDKEWFKAILNKIGK